MERRRGTSPHRVGPSRRGAKLVYLFSLQHTSFRVVSFGRAHGTLTAHSYSASRGDDDAAAAVSLAFVGGEITLGSTTDCPYEIAPAPASMSVAAAAAASSSSSSFSSASGSSSTSRPSADEEARRSPPSPSNPNLRTSHRYSAFPGAYALCARVPPDEGRRGSRGARNNASPAPPPPRSLLSSSSSSSRRSSLPLPSPQFARRQGAPPRAFAFAAPCARVARARGDPPAATRRAYTPGSTRVSS